MKITKNIFICVLLVLMLFLCINATSASETLDTNLTSTDTSDIVSIGDGDIVAGDSSSEVLGNDDIIVGDEGYSSSSAAVGAANGGETIFIKNGEYSESARIELPANEPLSSIGESNGVGEPQVNYDVYVSPEGDDGNDGSSIENAVKTIEHAVEIADNQIVILEGEYTINSLLNITKDLNIAGDGNVIVKSNVRYTIEVYDEDWDEWETEYHYEFLQNHANLNLSNIKVTLAPATTTDSLIYNYNNLFINNCEFNDIKVTGYKGVMRNNGKLTVNGTKFDNSVAKYSNILNYGELLVNNSEFRDNVYTDTGASAQAIQSSTKATIVNTVFVNNKGRTAGAISFPQNVNAQVREMTIINCTFDSNRADAGNGGAVSMASTSGTLNIKDSTFNQNTASTNGQALYVQGTTTIETSVLNDNIYVYSGTTNIKDSIISVTGSAINVGASSPTVTANDNWWGTNDKPNDYAETWVKMDASFAPGDAQAGEEVTVTATFDNDKLPDGVINVAFTSTSGNLNTQSAVNDAQATATYTIDDADESITATSGSASVVMPIQAPAPAGALYVSYENGNDNNNGLSEETALKTIAHAIDLADAGTGKIILLEGTHVLDGTLFPTEDLDITGQGVVIIDGNGNRFIQTTAGLNLTNIEFTNGYSSGSNLINLASSGTYLYLNKVKFYNNSGKYGVAAPADKRLVINNSEFYDNNLFAANQYSLGVIYSNSAITTIENTIFRNNTVQKGGGIWANRASSATIGGFVDIINCTFDGNIAQNGNGAAIFMSGSVTVTVANSTFINNLANASANGAGGYGSAVYIGTGTGKINITQSVFINNTGNGRNINDAGFYIGAGTLDVSDSIILTNDGDTRYAINFVGGSVTAENNWWGNNDEANTNAVVDNIVTMTAALDPENAQAGDAVTITVTFDNDKLPKGFINVSFTSSSGSLDEVVTMQGAQASVNYAGDANDLSITVKSSQAEQEFKFDPDAGIIFVLPGAADANPGTRDAPVGTIAHALEIASEGKIVLLEGVHKTDYLGVILDDLTITGEGNAIIDAQNSNTILLSDANVVIVNVTMVNGYTADEGGLLSNTGELTLINCTLANSSAPQKIGGAINNLGKLTIINTTIANCSSKAGGAIYTIVRTETNPLIIVNSTFENNVATGYERRGGGAIYAERGSEYRPTFTIENTSFVNNEAQDSCGGAIAIVRLDSTVKITDCEFVSNRATGQDSLGGAIYTGSATNYERGGTMTITGTLFENNTCGGNGGAVYASTTTVNVASSVLINNTDANGLAVYGWKSEQTTPAITLNDNWWGTNDSPKDLAGGNGYKPVLNRWAILTATNASEIKAGETVQLTVSINNYTDGTTTGTLSKPITVERPVTIATTFDEIEGVLENGEFVYDLAVPNGLKIITATVDSETVVLYVVTTTITVAIDNINAKKFESVEVTVNVTADDNSEINVGNVELYIGDNLIATIPVSQNKAIKEVIFSEDEGNYNLIAKYVEETGLFGENQTNATLTIAGIVELTNSTFFSFFDEEGILREVIDLDELVFHGDFSALGVDKITLTRAIAIKGDNAVLYGIAYDLKSDDIKLSDVTLVADGADFTSNNGAAIYASGAGIEITNVTVNYTAPSDKEAFGIFAKSAEEFKLTDSEINFVGTNHDYTNLHAHQYGLAVDSSNDVEIIGNVINAKLPALDVAWPSSEHPEIYGIYQDLVAPVAIQGGNNVKFSRNTVNTTTDGGYGSWPTIDSVLANGVNDLVIDYNNITHIDLTSSDVARYYYTIDLYNSTVTVENNNILVNTTSGIERMGAAYPIQLTGPINALINKNNLTSVSKGPNLGIYSADWNGDVDVTITDNFFNITGYAAPNKDALVSGMELQAEMAKVYNNTIFVYNIADYDDANQIYGISYAQWYYGDHSFDIRENNVTVEGKYAVYMLNAVNSNVTDNILFAHELMGDESVNISSGVGNIVKDNIPAHLAIIVTNSTLDLSVGDEFDLAATTVPDGVDVAYSSSNVSVVTVDADGKVVAVGTGSAIVTVSAGGDGVYVLNSTTVSVTVTESNVPTEIVIASDLIRLNVDDEVDSGASLTPAGAGELTFTSSNESVAIVENGKIKALAEGMTTITVSYAGDGNYLAAEDKTIAVQVAELFIEAYDVDMTYEDGSAYMVQLIDKYGNPVAKAKEAINITTHGRSYIRLTNDSGIAKVTIHLNASSYEATAQYGKIIVSNMIVVHKLPIVASDVNMVYKDGSAYIVQLVDINGNPFAKSNQAINITIAGKSYTRYTNASGAAKITINLAPGTYDVTAQYGDMIINNVVTVNKYSIEASDVNMEYKDGSAYMVQLVDGNGDSVAKANVAVNITIDGRTYTRYTDENGVAKVTINLRAGEYPVTAQYGDTIIENVVTVNNKYSIVASDLVMSYRDGSAFEVQLVDENGSPYALGNEPVKITVAGKTYTRYTDDNGVARIVINLGAGTYSVTTVYNNKTINNTITVNKT